MKRIFNLIVKTSTSPPIKEEVNREKKNLQKKKGKVKGNDNRPSSIR